MARNSHLRALLLLAAFGMATGPARAFIALSVDPQTVTVGEPVTIFGSFDCEIMRLDFGDGSPIQTFNGPANYSTVHVYTQPSPNPPGIWLVQATGLSCADGVDSAIISVIVNPGPGGPEPPPPVLPTGNLTIQRLNLHFENLRPQIRVDQNAKGLQAFAQIQYAGTGLLQGYWEVDGRVWSFVNRHLVFGNVVTLASPAVPGLPTVDPGVHRVRFVITQPAAGYTAPVALYFAGYDEAPQGEPLQLIDPIREARVPYERQRFRWSGPSNAKTYELSFLDEEHERVVFSALAPGPDYELPVALVEDRFVPGRRYRWQVIAYDAAGDELTRSSRRPFAFIPPERAVPNQIVVLTEWSLGGAQTVARLRDQYGLREVQSDRLEFLDVRLTVFETTQDAATVARAIAAEEGVLLAHPNFILQTSSEPHAGLQKVSSTLNFERLHQTMRGRRVRVAVIDSGVDTSHEDLDGRVVLDRSFVEDGRKAAEIHGTAVAGVIGASLNGTGIAGIAPETEILALRACVQLQPDHPKARCETAALARALDAALVEKARVVNMSFGTEDDVPLLALIIEKGSEAGVLFVAPVGNASWLQRVSFPARHPAVLAVGGQDESGGEYPNAALYRASRIVAPATNVFSSVPGNRYNFLSGTSLSSAIVTGLIALTLEERAVTHADLPERDANLCAWTERLTRIALCGPQLSKRDTRPAQTAGAP